VTNAGWNEFLASVASAPGRGSERLTYLTQLIGGWTRIRRRGTKEGSDHFPQVTQTLEVILMSRYNEQLDKQHHTPPRSGSFARRVSGFSPGYVVSDARDALSRLHLWIRSRKGKQNGSQRL